MSFLIQNITGSPGSNVELNDLGITIKAGETYDARFLQPQDVAASSDVGGDLYNAINTDKLIILDPLDGVTPLTKAQSIELGQVHNDPHFRIRGGTLNQLDDVDLTGAQEGDVLQLVGGMYVTATPTDLVGDGASAITDLFVDGVNTTVTRNGSPLTSIQVDVDDVFLKNTGDTLDSGTLTIASGAAVDFPTGSSLTIQDGATATITTPTGGFTGASDIVNKEYVDSVASGLDPKESVRVATTGDVGGTFTAGSPVGLGDTIAGASGVIDDITLVSGDRVLVKNQTDAKENGIYVVQTVNAGSPVTVDLVRAADQNGDPAAEVSGGNFTFVELGTANATTGWVVSGDGILTLGTDNITWVQFSESSDYSAGAGLGLSGTQFYLDVNNLVSATIALADEIAFNDVTDSNTTRNTTLQLMLNDLDIPYSITSNGFVVRTADNTFTSRSIAVNGAGALDGLAVTNGDGVSGNPTIGLDINGLPVRSDVVDVTDRVAVYNITTGANEYYTVGELAGAVASTNSFSTWAGAGNTTGDANIVADSSSDTATLTGGDGINIGFTASSDTVTFSLDLSTVPAVGSPYTIDGTDSIIVNDGGTTVSTTLNELINALGISTTDETVKVSANDTTAGYLDGKLVAGTYTTLTQNNDGGNETLTVDVDLSTISLEDLGNVVMQGSPAPADGDVLVYRTGSPAGWTNESLDAITAPAFGTVTGDTGSAVANVAGDSLAIVGGDGIATVAADGPETLTISLDFTNTPDTGTASPAVTPDGNTEFLVNIGGTVYTTTLNEMLAGAITGGNGISATSTGSPATLELSLDICGLTAGDTGNLDATDTIAVCDGTSTVGYTLNEIFQTLDVVSGVTGTGLVVKTGGSPDTYATRSVVESTTAGQEGAQVNNGDGASGNIEIGVDINNLSNSADDMVAADEFIVYDGANNVSMSGQQVADGVATILNLPDLVVSTINGQPIVTYTDTTRGTGSPPSGKRLSTDMLEYTWSQADVGNDDWIEIGNAVDALTGYVMPLNATIVGVVAQCTDADNKNKSILWYKDGTSMGTLFSFTGDGEQVYNSFVSMNLDLDINQGQKIRLRGDSSSGTIKDIVVTIYVRLRA